MRVMCVLGEHQKNLPHVLKYHKNKIYKLIKVQFYGMSTVMIFMTHTQMQTRSPNKICSRENRNKESFDARYYKNYCHFFPRLHIQK